MSLATQTLGADRNSSMQRERNTCGQTGRAFIRWERNAQAQTLLSIAQARQRSLQARTLACERLCGQVVAHQRQSQWQTTNGLYKRLRVSRVLLHQLRYKPDEQRQCIVI